MNLYTIRHGAYIDSFDSQGRKLVHVPETQLSPLGEEQAHQLAEQFQKRGILLEALYSSPYPRVRESANILAVNLRVSNVFEVDGLKDVFPNSANGKLWDDLEEIGADIYAHPMDDDPQESLDHLVGRARQTAQSILADAKERNYSFIGIVSHGDTLSAMDWVLKRGDFPLTYNEMKNAFYLQKAEACEYVLDQQFKLKAEGKIITTESVQQSAEGFRGTRAETES